MSTTQEERILTTVKNSYVLQQPQWNQQASSNSLHQNIEEIEESWTTLGGEELLEPEIEYFFTFLSTDSLGTQDGNHMIIQDL